MISRIARFSMTTLVAAAIGYLPISAMAADFFHGCGSSSALLLLQM